MTMVWRGCIVFRSGRDRNRHKDAKGSGERLLTFHDLEVVQVIEDYMVQIKKWLKGYFKV